MLFEAIGSIALLLAIYFILSPLFGIESFDNGGIVDAKGSGVTFYFFQTSWCGWSKKAWPHWKELKRLMDAHNVTYGGKTINLVEVDGDKSKDILKRYHVDGFPSFRLQTPEQVFEYSGAPSLEKFRKFFTDVLGQEVLS